MKKYRFEKPWKHWSKGDVVDEHTYRMLPYEIKNSKGFITPVDAKIIEPEVPVTEIDQKPKFEKVLKTKFQFSDASKKDDEILGNNLETF